MKNGHSGPDPIGAVAATPRTAKRGMGSRLSGGHLLMIVAGFLAFVLTLVVLSNRGETVKVAVANENLAPGTALISDVVKAVSIPASSPLVDDLVPYDQIGDGDQYAGRRIAANEPIARSAVVSKPSSANQREMSIRVDRANAVGGAIEVGDIVDVIAVAASGTANVDGTFGCRAAAGAEVLGVSERSSGGLGGGGDASGYFVTIAVPQVDQELFLASAIESATIHLVRATGAPLEELSDCGVFPAPYNEPLDEPGARVEGESTP